MLELQTRIKALIVAAPRGVKGEKSQIKGQHMAGVLMM